ncbi:MAG: hypothetical protein PUK41_08320 [Campylobacter hominis]|uniref:hypothetical protein n=1 Tax=Campylobacter TaxID=194 RepID=UPI0023F1858B|nr:MULTISPECIES: hypothetical protein [Campylobacter]MCI6641958.1 hypothetical protein [Campylobacter sp.]MDD7423338.1 hypothetical protein [Campylobacter hominis]
MNYFELKSRHPENFKSENEIKNFIYDLLETYTKIEKSKKGKNGIIISKKVLRNNKYKIFEIGINTKSGKIFHANIRKLTSNEK